MLDVEPAALAGKRGADPHAFFEHAISDAIRVGKVLSCFVTERKHRATKRAALFVFRSIDNTVATCRIPRYGGCA